MEPEHTSKRFFPDTRALESLGRKAGACFLICAAVSLSLTAIILIYWKSVPFNFTQYDDAYMFLRYAANLWAGHGIRWNVDGPATYGVSSPLYFFQIAALVKILPLSGPRILEFASIFNGLALLILMAHTVRSHASSEWLKKGWVIFPVVGAPLFADGAYQYHMLTGMDTTLAMLVHAALIGAALGLPGKQGAWRAAVMGVLSYAAFFCRIDNMIYAVLFPVLFILGAVPKNRWKLLVVWGAVFGVLLALDSAVKYALFGYVLPLPLYTKQQNFYPNFYGLIRYNPVTLYFDYLKTILPYLVVGLVSLRPGKLLFAAAFLIPQILTDIVFFHGVHIMGGEGRFFFPGLPFTVIPAFLLLDHFIAGEASAGNWGRLRVRGLIALLIMVIAVSGFSDTKDRLKRLWGRGLAERYDMSYLNFTRRHALRNATYWENMLDVNEILKKAPAGSSFAASEHGYLGSQNLEIKMIDVTGLHDAHIAHHGFSARYILAQQPDMIWFPHSDYIDAVRQFWDVPEFWSDYEYYPLAFQFGFAIRKTGPHYGPVKEAFSRVWNQSYPNISMERQKVSSRERILAMVNENSAP